MLCLEKKRCDFSSTGLTLMLQTARYSQSQLIKTDTVEAEFKDGVLNLSLPKLEPKPESKSTKIKIK
jgi:hypothetical protein